MRHMVDIDIIHGQWSTTNIIEIQSLSAIAYKPISINMDTFALLECWMPMKMLPSNYDKILVDIKSVRVLEKC